MRRINFLLFHFVSYHIVIIINISISIIKIESKKMKIKGYYIQIYYTINSH